MQDGGRAMMVDKEEVQRVVSSCNDFAEAEKRSKHTSNIPLITVNCEYCLLENYIQYAPVACMLYL